MVQGISKTFEVLGSLRSDQTQRLALAALDEDDPEILGTAARFVAGWSDPTVLNKLIERFEWVPDSSKNHISENPTALLGHLRERFAGFTIDRKGKALHLLEHLEGIEPIRVLLRAVRDDDPAVARRAFDRIKELVALLAAREDPFAGLDVDDELATVDRTKKDAASLIGQLMIAEDNLFLDETLDLLFQLGPAAYDQLRILLMRTDTIEKKDRAKACILRDLATTSDGSRIRFLIHLLINRRYAPIVRQVLSSRDDEEFLDALTIDLAAQTPDTIVHAITAAHEYPWFDRFSPRVARLDEAGVVHLLAAAKRVLRDPDTRAVFYRAVSEHPSEQAQEVLLSDLDRLDPADARECIAGMLRRESNKIQVAATRYLLDRNLPDRHALLRPLIDSPFPQVRALVGHELAQLGFKRFLETYDVLPGSKRAATAHAIHRLDPSIVGWVIQEIGKLGPKMKVRTLIFLDMIGKVDEAEQVLIRLIGDPDRQVRATVVNLLGEIKNVHTVKVLLRALKDSDRRVCANAIEAFEALANPRSVPLLVPYLQHPDNRVRANAGKALYNLGYHKARFYLEAMLKDPKLLNRLSAVWAIGELDYDGAEEALREVARSDNQAQVRSKATEMLAAIEARRHAAGEGM